MKHLTTKQMEPDRLRKTWDKFKSQMLKRKSTGFSSAVQSLFISELGRCSSGLENELGISASHLRIFDSFLARFEDQCMLRIFLKFEKFKLLFLQADYNGNEPGCEKHVDSNDVDDKMQFTLGQTNPEPTGNDFNLIKDDVAEHKMACEKSEANEEIRDSSLFEAAGDGKEKDYTLFSSAINEEIRDSSLFEAAGDSKEKDDTLFSSAINEEIRDSSLFEAAGDSKEKDYTLFSSAINEEIRDSSLFEAADDGREKDDTLFSSAIKGDNSYSQLVCEQTSPYMSSVKRRQNDSKKETTTKNYINAISINEKSEPCEPNHLKEQILQDFSHRKKTQRKTCLMKNSSKASFYLKNLKGRVNCPEKSKHTQNHKLRNIIHCLECGFVNENAGLFNEPMKSHTKIVAGHCCCNCSGVLTQESILATSSELSVLCKQQRNPQAESPTSLVDKRSVSEGLPKQNSSNSERSLSSLTLPSDSNIRLKRELRCEIFQKHFQRATCLKRHKLTHNEEKPYVHRTCDTVPADRSHNNSRRTHPKNKPFQCDICEMAFSKSTKLKYHKQVHTGEKQFVCEICGALFLSMFGFKNHTRIHSGKKPYKCNICDYASVYSSNLKAHLLIHSGEKKYSCDKCGSCFIDKAKLRRHIMVHTGERPYKCEVCGVTFADKSHLTVHLRTHSGEKPFICTFCSAAFVESSKLKTHLRTHTGEKPYMCEVCGTSFAVAYGLKSHMRRHTGEKLYKCNVCAYASSQSSNLKTHMSIHSGTSSHVCEMCGAAFSESSKLTRHRITHLD